MRKTCVHVMNNSNNNSVVMVTMTGSLQIGTWIKCLVLSKHGMKLDSIVMYYVTLL